MDEDSIFLIILALVLIVIVLRVSIVFWPERESSTWTSRATTGWTNTPKKLAWSETIRKVAEDV